MLVAAGGRGRRPGAGSALDELIGHREPEALDREPGALREGLEHVVGPSAVTREVREQLLGRLQSTSRHDGAC
jgi:hypothetical protein